MDTIPDKEFVGIFQRSAKYINMKDAVSEEILDNRMKAMQKAMMKAKHKSKKESTKRKWNAKQKAISKLRQHGFAGSVMERARRIPIILESIRVGFKQAQKNLLKHPKRMRRRRYR